MAYRFLWATIVFSMFIVYHTPLEARTQFAGKHAEFKKCEWESPAGGVLKYRMYAPETVEGETYPLIIFLHGAGERGDNNESQLVHDEWMNFLFGEHGQKMYVIAPQCPNGEKWCEVSWGNRETHKTPDEPSAPLRMTHEVVQEMIKTLPVDAKRVYVTGLSMGGYGTFDYLVRWGDEIAAAVPLCGGADNEALKNTEHVHSVPVWIFHGDQDGAVPVQRSRNAAAALKDVNPKMKYTELPGVGHDVWTPAYNNEALQKWLIEQKKK